MINSSHSIVYWIHHPKHTDITSEGYVGVTKRSLVIRANQHVKRAINPDVVDVALSKAIKKYKNELIIKAVCVCDEDYAYELENKLRPTTNIGWNIRDGGEKPNSEYQKSLWDREGYREGHIRRMQDLWSDPEFYERGMKHLSDGLEKQQKLIKERPWMGSKSKWARHHVWPIAQEIYDWWKDSGEPGRQSLTNDFGFETDCLKKMHSMFKSGWVPEQDFAWKEDFVDGAYRGYDEDPNSVSPVKYTEDVKNNIRKGVCASIEDNSPWEFPKSDINIWRRAAEIYDQWIFLGKPGRRTLGNHMEISDQKLVTIIRNFKDGWVPREDSKWVERFLYE